MSGEDWNYYKSRAEQELAQARGATSPEAARVHYELAGLYLNRVHGNEGGEPSIAAR